nr:DUF234 domain-containing protein [Salinigranum halophilum]
MDRFDRSHTSSRQRNSGLIVHGSGELYAGGILSTPAAAAGTPHGSRCRRRPPRFESVPLRVGYRNYDFRNYVSPLFERRCQRALPDLIDRQFRDVGQWWFKEHELDVLGLTGDGLVAGECTFTSRPVSEGVLADLERTASKVRWSEEPADGETLYVLFSRSGYTDDLTNVADRRDDIRLFELSDLLTTDTNT